MIGRFETVSQALGDDGDIRREHAPDDTAECGNESECSLLCNALFPRQERSQNNFNSSCTIISLPDR